MTDLEQRIRERAYKIWRYHQDTEQTLILDKLGNLRERTAEDDWLEAEAKIRSQYGKS